MPLYDRITSEFYQQPLHVCGPLQRRSVPRTALGRHAAGAPSHASRPLIAKLPDSPDVKHATFQAGHLRIDTDEWQLALALSDALLARSDLDGAERVEAMAMRSQALLGLNDLASAERQAQQTLTYYRTHPEDLATDPYYAAAANFVVAETIRLRAEAMAFPDTNQDEQRAVLVRRAQLLLDAQREYFNAVLFTNAHWAAASGNRIGAMYDKLWHDLMAAPCRQTLSGARQGSLSAGTREADQAAVAPRDPLLGAHAHDGGAHGCSNRMGRGDPQRSRTCTRTLLLDQPPGAGGLPPEACPSSGRAHPRQILQARGIRPPRRRGSRSPQKIPQACEVPELLDTSRPRSDLRAPSRLLRARGCVFCAFGPVQSRGGLREIAATFAAGVAQW